MNLRLLKFFVLTLLAYSGYSQNLSYSPYSRFGMGELLPQSFATQNAMGQIGQGLRNNSGLNLLNPASYSAFTFTSYEAGMQLSRNVYKTNLLREKGNNASMSYMALGIPVSLKRKIGAVAGLMPYASSSYTLDDSVKKLNNSVIVRDYAHGHGEFNRAFLGIGKSFFNTISVGVNVNYIWGNDSHTVASFYPQDSGYFSPVVISTGNVGSIMFDGGIQLHHIFSAKKIKNTDTTYKRYMVVVGASGNLSSKLKGSQNYLFGNTVYTGDPTKIGFWDTITYNPNQKGAITIPQQYRVGLSFARMDKWNLYIDYEQSQWEKFESFGHKEPLSNRTKMAIGYSWIPNKMANIKKQYFKRVEYRLGIRQEKLYYIINGKQIEERALCGGVSLPVLIPKGSAMPYESARLHLSFDFTQRGTTTNNLVLENIWHIYFGITFTDKWFIQRKIF